MGGRGASSKLKNNPYIYMRPEAIQSRIEQNNAIIRANYEVAHSDYSDNPQWAQRALNRRSATARNRITKADAENAQLKAAYDYAKKHNRNIPF